MKNFPEIKGTIDNWDVIVAGHLRVNTYFGESYDNPPRGDPSTCTSVMVRGKETDGKPFVLIIDATLRWKAEDYDFDINRRTGLHLKDVTHCFVTHHHLDHYEALPYFPNAKWMAAKPVAGILHKEATKVDASRITGVENEFLPGVCAVHLPGHTETLHGTAFSYKGKKILVAGDSVMSKYHLDHETTDFQKDPELNQIAAQTIRDMKETYDIIIPGHDNIVVM